MDWTEETPEEVPNWYLYQQNRSIQRSQEMLHALGGILVYLFGVSLFHLSAVLALALAALGSLIFAVAMLKVLALDPDSRARRVCDRFGLPSWVDAKAKIAERQAVADGGEEQ